MDYIEIMSFCGYDLDRADKMVNEIVKDMEEVPAEPVRAFCRRLRSSSDQRRAWDELERGL